jgi:tRNA (adenine37-N6)-methyltransferase
MTDYTVTPIGHVRSSRTAATDDFWGAVEATIALDAMRFAPAALFGLDGFSHVEVLFLMHGVDPAKVETGARHPRERQDWPLTGIFAQRGKARPNRLGLSRAEILRVDGLTLSLRGLDAIDGTPVLDIKPWMDEFAPRGATRQPAWVGELMADYYNA